MKHTLRQLEVFVAVARLGSVTAAADAVALSQSAASMALSEFERQFDCRLFERVGKSLRINSLGEQLLPKAVELLDRAAEIEALLEGRSGLGTLRIGATLTIGNYLATLIVADFLQHHAEARVQLTVHNTATIVEQVAQYELDLGLIEGACRHPSLITQPWVEDELVIFAAPGHPLLKQRKVTLDVLLQERWILREQGSGTREVFEQALRRHCIEPGRLSIRLELEHTEAIKRAVESGLGISCISRLALKEAFRRGSLAPIEVAGLDLGRRFQFLWHRDKYHTAVLREFLAACQAMTATARRSDLIELPYIA
ncbi:MAG: LysR family transcriptional regulator [Sterolibacterium sp.]|nr:LysR family transcriptional regulator [Sterolibacterium sp.]